MVQEWIARSNYPMTVGGADMEDPTFPVVLVPLRCKLKKIALGPTLEEEHATWETKGHENVPRATQGEVC